MMTQKKDGIDLEFIEQASKHSKNSAFLSTIVEDNYKNSAICIYVARNRYADSKTLEKLAFHPETQVRLEVVQRAEVLTSAKSLMKLAYDPNINVRRILAQRTSNEAIKMLLLKSPNSDKEIIKECLRRIKDEKRVIEYIKASPVSEKQYAEFLHAALNNSILSANGIQCLNELLQKVKTV